jgi:hypothetical protein
MPDLFATAEFAGERRDETIALGAVLLRWFALPFADDILAALGDAPQGNRRGARHPRHR